MSTKPKPTSETTASPALLTVRELGALILQHQGIHHGLFDVKVEFQLATGGVGPNTANLLPGIIIGISKVGVTPSEKPNETTIDAAIVNPPAKRLTVKRS